ncbi:hypothetical protein ACFLYU_05470 [Candidatus Dependentiae bacterium]
MLELVHILIFSDDIQFSSSSYAIIACSEIYFCITIQAGIDVEEQDNCELYSAQQILRIIKNTKLMILGALQSKARSWHAKQTVKKNKSSNNFITAKIGFNNISVDL